MRKLAIALVVLAALIGASNATAQAPAITAAAVWPRYSGDMTFSPDGQQVTYYQTDANGAFQQMVSSANGTNAQCISCQTVPGGPAADTDKDGGVWDPAGGWIATTVLEPSSPTWGFRHSGLGYYFLNNGIGSSLWVVTPDGQKWFKLRALGEDGNYGILPQIAWSKDGQTIIWSECMKGADSTYFTGQFHLFQAHFAVDSNGVPSFQNITDITPPYPGLYEPGSITPDGQDLIFTSDATPPAPAQTEAQIYEMNLSTHAVRPLTANTSWNEHPHVTPDGQAIAWLHDGEAYAEKLADAPSDGERLTYLNTSWIDPAWTKAVSGEWPVIPIPHDFSPDGTKLAVVVESIWHYPTSWATVLTFNAPVG